MDNKGLIVNVARSTGTDCSRNGLSARFDTLTVVGTLGKDDAKKVTPLPFDARVFDAHANRPAVALRLWAGPSVHVVPVQQTGDGYAVIDEWVMFGGNYAASSDSRLRRTVEDLLGHSFYGAISIHDRIER
jgi:hypothetical protein